VAVGSLRALHALTIGGVTFSYTLQNLASATLRGFFGLANSTGDRNPRPWSPRDPEICLCFGKCMMDGHGFLEMIHGIGSSLNPIVDRFQRRTVPSGSSSSMNC